MQLQNAEVVKQCKRDIQQYMYTISFLLLTLNLIFFFFSQAYTTFCFPPRLDRETSGIPIKGGPVY